MSPLEVVQAMQVSVLIGLVRLDNNEARFGRCYYKNKNKNIYYSNQWAHNRGKQIAYIDYCHWRQLYILYMYYLIINTVFTYDGRVNIR
jgi:hypothetical protein